MEYMEVFVSELSRQDKSPATIRNYTGDVVLFFKWLKQTYGECGDPERVAVRDIQEYRGWLTISGKSPATINRYLASLATFFEIMIDAGRCKENPARRVKSLHLIDPGPRALDTSSLRRLLREVNIRGNLRDICIIEILANTAIRIGELASLNVDDIKLSERKGSLSVRYGKGRLSREIPLNHDARDAIRNYLGTRRQKSGSLIMGQRGERMTANGLWRVVKKYAQYAEVLDMRVHDLRHTVLTRLVREFGHDLATVAKISGHRDYKTLLRYIQPTMADLEGAMEQLSFVPTPQRSLKLVGDD